MKIARIRTATVFSKRKDVMDLSKFIDSLRSFEDSNIEVRTKRVVVDRKEFSLGDLVAFSKDIEEMGFWGFCVSFDDPTDEDQIASARKGD